MIEERKKDKNVVSVREIRQRLRKNLYYSLDNVISSFLFDSPIYIELKRL